jgi:glycosyltransferase involved in cell wall biosynthesis
VSLVSNTNRSGYEHVVCYLHAPDDFAEEIRQAGQTVIRLDSSGKGQWFSAARKLLRIIKEQRPDIIQTWLHDGHISARLAQLLVRQLPLISTVQNADYEPETVRAANWPHAKSDALRRIDKVTAQWSRPVFVACSQFVKQSTRRHLGVPESSIQVIYNSVDPESLRCDTGEPQRLRESLEIPDDGFIFLSVGRLDPQKGQANLLRAFQQIAASNPNLYLAIAGDGPLGDELKQLSVELGIDKQVRFLGRRKDIGACLEMADVFVFPSLFEGLPLALVEAMFKKLPCIVSRIDTLLEVISDEESGLLVTPGSVEELAQAMTRLYTDPERRKMLGLNAYQVALERFNQQTTIPQWESLYDSIAQKAAHEGRAASTVHHLI